MMGLTRCYKTEEGFLHLCLYCIIHCRVTIRRSTKSTASKRTELCWIRARRSSSPNWKSWTTWTCSTATKFLRLHAGTWFAAYRWVNGRIVVSCHDSLIQIANLISSSLSFRRSKPVCVAQQWIQTIVDDEIIQPWTSQTRVCSRYNITCHKRLTSNEVGNSLKRSIFFNFRGYFTFECRSLPRCVSMTILAFLRCSVTVLQEKLCIYHYHSVFISIHTGGRKSPLANYSPSPQKNSQHQLFYSHMLVSENFALLLQCLMND